jgi:hypothetical protein
MLVIIFCGSFKLLERLSLLPSALAVLGLHQYLRCIK